MIKLVLADMDGTLVPFGAPCVSARTLEAIYELRAAGISFAPATGREPVDLRPFFHGDESCYENGILANGKMVYVGGRLVSSRALDHDALVRLGEYALAHDGTGFVMFVPQEDGSVRRWLMARDPQAVASLGTDVMGLGTVGDAVPDVDIYTTAFFFDPAQYEANALREHLEQVCPELEFPLPAPAVFDVLPAGFSKVSVLALLLDALHVKPDEVAYLGDSENDVTMMGRLEHSYCVDNGSHAAKEAARYLVPSAQEDGPARVMEQLARNGGDPALAADEAWGAQ